MDIAGARRGVEDEVVEVPPVGVGNKLLQGTGGHTATPEGSSGGRYKETDGE